ncbi:chemotaxis protein CheA [Salirhabdus salicampi]|uniref:chemotaxis protein CheA n=1 Tax=Salirhabdus salicampi TaxID=476102 RepID=UPI0020C1C403|nr:chemotaxis protein CheA [Salirhabdus salicampi]MCP8616501.1 chemotaxis protein CheA [Salirhabdus salicampi]
MDTSQYISLFIEESNEHLQLMNDYLLKLEKDPSNEQIVTNIFRSAHTIKGMAATMGFVEMSDVTHKLENIFELIRQKQININSSLLDVVFQAVQQLESVIEDITNGGTGSKSVDRVIYELERIEKHATIKSEIEDTNEFISLPELETIFGKVQDPDNLRKAEKENNIIYYLHVMLQRDTRLKSARAYMVFHALRDIGELVEANPSMDELEFETFGHTLDILFLSKVKKQLIQQRIENISEIADVQIKLVSIHSNQMEEKNELPPDTSPTLEKEAVKRAITNQKSIRVNVGKLDQLMNLFEQFVIDRGRLEKIANDLQERELQDTVDRISRVSSNMQDIILNMRMVPIEHVFKRFPKMVRKLTRELNKNIQFHMEGEETELDRNIIEQIGDPLVHLIRNSIDHGIESPGDRVERGKPPEGKLVLRAYQSGNQVIIEVEDDGHGINKEKIVQQALSKGLIHEEQRGHLSEDQIFELVMTSGFSTAEEISNISGRGVGLDVVKNTIESIGGSISIHSKRIQGTRFTIRLPLTLSIVSVMLVQSEQETYGIPITSIVETIMYKKVNIHNIQQQEMIFYRNKTIPLMHLADLFQIPKSNQTVHDSSSIIIVRKGERMAGIVVDSAIGQQEVVLKSLGKYLTNIHAISGATILGDGQVALVIDSNVLVK